MVGERRYLEFPLAEWRRVMLGLGAPRGTDWRWHQPDLCAFWREVGERWGPKWEVDAYGTRYRIDPRGRIHFAPS